jgi:hypothetical protein
MPRKVMVLSAVAGLLIFAFAAPRAGFGLPARLPAGQILNMDSIRMLHGGPKVAALPSGIDVNKVIQQTHSGRQPEPPVKLGAGSYEPEFMPASGILNPPGDSTVNAQEYVAVAFDGTKYLVVWEDSRDGYWHIYGALVPASGTPPVVEGFAISPNSRASDARYPSVAFDGTNYLVVWGDGITNDGDIYGQRVNTSGGLEGSAITISDAQNVQFEPRVAFNGTNYLVVWSDYRNGNYYDVYGALLSTAGAVLTPPGDDIAISVTETMLSYPVSVSSDGEDFLVAWEDYRAEWVADIYGARVTNAGGVLDPDGFLVSTNTEETNQYLPSIAFDGDYYLVAWEDRTSGSDIYGARMRPSDHTVLDPNGFAIATHAAGHYLYKPAVAFDGTEYLVVWMDTPLSGTTYIYGRSVSLEKVPGTIGQVSTRESGFPALTCGPVERTAMVAYHSTTDEVSEVDYGGMNRVWGARVTVTLSGTVDVGTVSIVRPIASFLWSDGENYSLPIPPAARLVNNGTEPCSFNAQFSISTSGYPTSAKTVLGLRPGETRSVEFDHDSFDLATEGPGLYAGKCTTMLAGDGTPGNDSKSAIFQGCDFINFFDLENGGLTATGAWARGKPQSPWTFPPMDTAVWGDDLDGTYADNENATLTSPEYEASRANPAIAFQYSYNTATGNDGGNFSYSTGSYSSWDTLFPSAGKGYDGSVSALSARGWSGNSGGWVQSVFTIPVTSGAFKVRWRFASDGTSEDLPGWLIDEVAGIGCDLGGKMGAAGYIDTMKVWPNPARGKAQVSYTLRKAGNVSVKLYDASGRLAAQVPTSGFKKGRNTATFDATRVARGVYFVKVEGASNFKTTKVIIE